MVSPASAALGAPPGSGGAAAPNVVSLGRTWAFSSSIVQADPGSANFRLNNATQSAATALFVSDTADSGVDVGESLDALDVGDRIYMQDRTDKTKFHLFAVNGPVIDNTTWHEVPITSVDAGSDFADADVVTLGFHLIAADSPDIISPVQITSDQNDYAGTANSPLARLDSDASRAITGIAPGGTDHVSRNLRLVNVGANDIILAHNNGGSALANRILTGTGFDATIPPGGVADLWYDLVTTRWRVAQA